MDVGEGAAAGVVIALCVSGQRSSARVWKLVRVFAGEPFSPTAAVAVGFFIFGLFERWGFLTVLYRLRPVRLNGTKNRHKRVCESSNICEATAT